MPTRDEVLKALLHGHRVCSNETYGQAEARRVCVRTIEEIEERLGISRGTTTDALAREKGHSWARGISGRRKRKR